MRNLKLNQIDILEDEIYENNPEILITLLKDHSSNKNIIWATNNYTDFGNECKFEDELKIETILSGNKKIIQPRIAKSLVDQNFRTKENAEVFTPAWMCNEQINEIENTARGKIGNFNFENKSGWVTNENKINYSQSKEKDWHSYIQLKYLEISCGESPYLTSRYDHVSGIEIPFKNRIGVLDRKLRVLNDNVLDEKNWLKIVINVLKSIYGFDWQGDNVLLSRENILFSTLEAFAESFNKLPSSQFILELSKIISWNIWQMDGLKFVIPQSCHDMETENLTLFGVEKIFNGCEGCNTQNYQKHNGIYCKIMDWDTNKSYNFSSLLKDNT